MRAIPEQLWAVFDGDDNRVLATFDDEAKATKECVAFNNLKGYEPNCFVVGYVRLRGEAHA